MGNWGVYITAENGREYKCGEFKRRRDASSTARRLERLKGLSNPRILHNDSNPDESFMRPAEAPLPQWSEGENGTI